MIVLGHGEGTVAAFDGPRGVGEVRGTDGRTWFFHCTAVADGTRTVAEGAEVRFDVVAGRLGRWEAANLRAR